MSQSNESDTISKPFSEGRVLLSDVIMGNCTEGSSTDLMNRLYDHLYPDAGLSEDVIYDQISNGTVTDDFDLDNWGQFTIEKQLAILFHKLAQIESDVDQYSVKYWNRIIDLYYQFQDNKSEIESELGESISGYKLKYEILQTIRVDTINLSFEDISDRIRNIKQIFDHS